MDSRPDAAREEYDRGLRHLVTLLATTQSALVKLQVLAPPQRTEDVGRLVDVADVMETEVRNLLNEVRNVHPLHNLARVQVVDPAGPCPACGVTEVPHRHGRAHDARLTAAAMEVIRHD